jgi:predicted transcriptional regulator
MYNKYRMNSHHIQIRSLVSKSIRNTSRVSIITSRKKPTKNTKERSVYLNFTNQINNTFEELTNEIFSELESCSYDYSDEYVSLAVMSPEGHETVHLIYVPEIPEI